MTFVKVLAATGYECQNRDTSGLGRANVKSTHYRASSTIIAAPFSAIIAVGVLVFPDVMVGITEASATRRPAIPRNRRRSSTTAIGSFAVPILAVPTG